MTIAATSHPTKPLRRQPISYLAQRVGGTSNTTTRTMPCKKGKSEGYIYSTLPCKYIYLHVYTDIYPAYETIKQTLAEEALGLPSLPLYLRECNVQRAAEPFGHPQCLWSKDIPTLRWLVCFLPHPKLFQTS
ncbi:hypothetical protein Pelo_4513 [Pelomyxa schiedti]|nr:hypothetical protein Pelo_4513 [Pelomyxa schiedti]